MPGRLHFLSEPKLHRIVDAHEKLIHLTRIRWFKLRLKTKVGEVQCGGRSWRPAIDCGGKEVIEI